MASIRLDRLAKSFGRHTAVQGMDIEMRDGEFMVFLGPSGCGKTTTLNCIAGLETPSSGRVLFDGEDVTSLPPHARNVAMVFQSSLLYPHMTARQNVMMSLKKQALSADEVGRRVAEAAAVLEIKPLLDRMPSELSGGERQRVATAKAIVRHPSVFLFDEPLAALDAALRLTLRAELVNLQKRLATTTILVTHDQVEAMTMGDRIAVISQGRLEQVGTPVEIYERPATLFVAAFVGSPPMNLFEGEVVARDGRPCFVAGELTVPLPVALASGNVTLGVRPQHLAVATEPVAGALPATAFALEHLGKESVLIVEDAGRNRLRALVPPAFDAKVGERLFVMPDPAHCLLFDRSGALL
jgi:ABC-type sugar transport system ATPase subunit